MVAGPRNLQVAALIALLQWSLAPAGPIVDIEGEAQLATVDLEGGAREET